jgi:hypothetical protein
MITDRRGNAGIARAPLKHAPGVRLSHRAIGEHAGTPVASTKKRTLAIAGEARGLNVVLEIGSRDYDGRASRFPYRRSREDGPWR